MVTMDNEDTPEVKGTQETEVEMVPLVLRDLLVLLVAKEKMDQQVGYA